MLLVTVKKFLNIVKNCLVTDYATKEASIVNTSIEEDLESQEEALIEE
jgi:hypothetical protein